MCLKLKFDLKIIDFVKILTLNLKHSLVGMFMCIIRHSYKQTINNCFDAYFYVKITIILTKKKKNLFISNQQN